MAVRKKVSASKRIQAGLRDLEKRMPRNMQNAIHEARANLRKFQQQLERARKDRDTRWRAVQTQMRRDVVRLLQRLEKAVAPSGAAAGARPARAPRRKKR